MNRLLDTDPDYRFTWSLVPFNGATEHEFEWCLRVSSDYLPLGEQGYTEGQLNKLNNYFNASTYKQTTRIYNMSNYREEYASFKAFADQITSEIIRKAL